MMEKTNMSAKLFYSKLPKGATLMCSVAVKDDAHPLGSALIRFDATGIYSMLNAGVLSSCDQHRAAELVGSPKSIKEILDDHGLSQREASRILDIPWRTISNWCTGVNTPPAYLPKLIAFYLDHAESNQD